ncbi:MAG: EAL domain-containing protein [Sporomusaceae bacterium]|nr:EAL domain-containing protein [Sporomusaceae bacterium]
MHDWKEKYQKNINSTIPLAFQYIAERVLDGILVFDCSGKVVYTNHAASKIYGYSAEEFKQLGFHELYAIQEESCFDRLMRSARQEAVLCQAIHRKRDKLTFAVRIKYCKVRLEETEFLMGIFNGKEGNQADKLFPDDSEKNYQLLHEELLAAYEELMASEEELRQQFDELLSKEGKIYQQNTVLNLLHEMTAGLMTDNDSDDAIFEKIVAGVKELFQAPHTYVHVFDEAKGTYTVKTGTGMFTTHKNEVDITKALVGQAYRTGKVAAVSNYHAWKDRLPHSIFDNVDYCVVMPLKQKDRMFGALGLVFVEPGRVLSEEELFLLQRFADLAAIALRNFFLVASLRKKIEEHQREAKQRRQSEERFFTAFQMSPSAVAIARIDGTYADVNESFCQSTGYTRAELIGSTREQIGLWHEADKKRLLEELEKQGQVNNLEAWFRRKDGREICGLMSARMVTIEDERYILTITHDITQRIQAERQRRQQEAALIDSRNMLAVAAGLASLGPWEYTPSTGLFTFSDEFYNIYATNVANEGLSMSWDHYAQEFVHPEDLWMLKNEQNFLLSSERVEAIEPVDDLVHRIIRRDGQVRTVLVRRFAVKDAAGRFIKVYGTNQDITERVKIEAEKTRQEEAIKHMAYFDSLTDLANRRQLNEWLAAEMEHARRGEAYGAVLFIDLDDLKLINDTYGHTYGDKIIVEAGLRIVSIVGKDVFVARVGGDEFVVVLSGIKEHSKIKKIVYELNMALGRTKEIFGSQFHMAASIGIAAYPADGSTTEEIIKNADNAMYAAKRGGKNCWRFYTEEMQQEAYQEMRLTNSLRYALALQEFSLVYQPQIDPVRKKIIGFEALLRWRSAEHGIVSPLQFIPLAERAGLIPDIGQWVLNEACRFARRLTDQGWSEVHVAVNISAKQIVRDDFIAIVLNAMKAAKIEAQQLELEITESSLMASMEDAVSKLIQLKNLGIKLSLDDFGTGFSSLTYLLNLPVTTLKIDKSFIDMITAEVPGVKIISSIINMAHDINMKVVAEGVETEEQLAYLLDHRCDYIQGYLFSRPLTETAAIQLLIEQAENLYKPIK